MQVFWPWSSFRMSACTVPRTLASTHALILAASVSVGSRPLSALNLSMFWSMAVFMNMARIVGAGPLMVMDTEVAGCAQIEAAVEHLHVVQRGDAHARVAHLAVDVRAWIGVVAVQRDRIEGGGQALGRHAFAEQLEALVGAEGVAFAGEHAGRVFAFALEGEGAGGVGVAAGHVVEHQPLQDFAVVLVLRQGHLADHGAREGFGGQRGADFLVADLHHILITSIGLLHVGPLRQQLACVAVQPIVRVLWPGPWRPPMPWGGGSCPPPACARLR